MSNVRPLEGIRVFELAIAISGPTVGRYLAHFGAEVIMVESRKNPNPGRIGSAWVPRDEIGVLAWLDTGASPNETMTGKKNLGLDLKAPEGLEAAKRLLSRCDIFLSNYSAPAVAGLGLDYESVRAVKPDIIYAMLSGFGMTPSPYFDYLAFGPNQAPVIGIDDLTGWPDRGPSAFANHSYPDFTNAGQGLLAILTALDYRDRTGKGQCIDISQFEGTVSILGSLLMGLESNGDSPSRMGNRLPWAAPHGVYPCRGNDRWVAISVFNEDEWLGLCKAFDHPEWAEDPHFLTLQERLSNQDELDALISEWTSQHSQTEITHWLQSSGVPAAPVMDTTDLAKDPQLAARDFWVLADDLRFGKELSTGVPIRLTATPGFPERARPALGQDNEQVLGEICGYSAEEIQGLIEKTVVFPMAGPEVHLERQYLPWIHLLMPHLPWPKPGFSKK